MHRPTQLSSFFLGGFECSSHRREDGRRLDLLASTAHDRNAAADYKRMREHGLLTVRDGLRWHLIEKSPWQYDWSSFLPMLRAARENRIQVIWDLCHYGWPDDLDIWSPAFVDRFAAFAKAAAAVMRDEGITAPLVCPVNEISYWSWAGGETSKFWPLGKRRGDELKRQLARAAIASVDALRGVVPQVRTVFADPAINVVAASAERRNDAERARLAQYAAWDLLTGREQPELGGRDDIIDIIGVNYYSDNQWVLGGKTIEPGDKRYRPFSDMLGEIHSRYAKPILIAETGAEGEARAKWLRYVCDEVLQALVRDVPVEGVCLYPVLDYPGWINDRHCETGLFGFADAEGQRSVHAGLAQQLAFEQARVASMAASASSLATEPA
ncbi:beta-glucosidase [Hydrocarboniphaga effusa]|uniref:beta-glucosidase n=1 Tax=Hydrocarboniphaga effusa TaxID=243629 RepID=UPI00398BFAF2